MTVSDQPADPSVFILDTGAWKHFLSFFQRDYAKIGLCSMLSVIQALLFLPVILLIRTIFDTALPQGNIWLLYQLGILIFVVNLASALLDIWVKSINLGIIHTAIFRLREDLLIKLYSFSRLFYTGNDHKLIHTRIVQDTERLSNMSNALMSNLLPSLFICLVLSMILMIINTFLFLVLAVLFAALFLSNRFMGKRLGKRIYRFQRAFEKFSRGTMFTLRFMDLTKIQSAESHAIEQQTNTLSTLRNANRTMHLFFALNHQLETFMTSTASVVIIVVGGAAISMKSMTIGDFFSFYLAVGFLYRHLRIITDSFMKIVEGNQSLTTLKYLWENHHQEPVFGTEKIQFSGALTLRSVSFSYGEKTILNGINLTIKPGERLALLGPNGTGKTTLLHIILGFYAPDSGTILADNLPYGTLDIPHLRKSIGMVMQHPPLFNGTIRENICYGTDCPDAATLDKTAKLSLLHDVLKKLSNGWDTDVGDEGLKLSGGERQRIAIARALLCSPSLLILDEPTNHLDASAVKRLMENLDTLDHKPAVIIVSHDRSVICHADRVLTLENGNLSSVPIKKQPEQQTKRQNC